MRDINTPFNTSQPMTRRISLLCLFAFWLTSLQSATIHHKMEFDTSKESSSYTPMLEVGKEGRYTLWNDIVFEPDDPTAEGEMVIRIEDCKERDA